MYAIAGLSTLYLDHLGRVSLSLRRWAELWEHYSVTRYMYTFPQSDLRNDFYVNA